MNRLVRVGFTLIELLVVLSIIVLLTGMLLGTGALRRDQAGLRVEEAARGVERRLLEARNGSIASGKPYAVIFHIENAGSGRVLRNGDVDDPKAFPGRHWCAVIGSIPRLSGNALYSSPAFNGSAQRYAATVERAQVGERYYLPRGARFLALGDAEDNLQSTSAGRPLTTSKFIIDDWSVDTQTRTGISELSDTYPRPWFGFLQESGGIYTLHPWGGYDPAIYGSGLDYECVPRGGTLTHNPIVNSTNSELCSCWFTGNATKSPAVNQLLEEERPCCDASQIGKPRPLINGFWQDFMIVFLPNGQTRTLTFYSRSTFFSQRTKSSSSSDREYPKDIVTNYGWPPITDSYRGRDDAIIVLESEAIGGTSITVAKDAPEVTYTFDSPQKALQSIIPMRRIIVSEVVGGVRVIKPFASIQLWLEDVEKTVPTDQRIWENGYEFCSASDANPNKIRVTGAVSTEMLTQHDPYPWIKPKP